MPVAPPHAGVVVRQHAHTCVRTILLPLSKVRARRWAGASGSGGRGCWGAFGGGGGGGAEFAWSRARCCWAWICAGSLPLPLRRFGAFGRLTREVLERRAPEHRRVKREPAWADAGRRNMVCCAALVTRRRAAAAARTCVEISQCVRRSH